MPKKKVEEPETEEAPAEEPTPEVETETETAQEKLDRLVEEQKASQEANA